MKEFWEIYAKELSHFSFIFFNLILSIKISSLSIKPSSNEIRVDFPEPEGPTIATLSPLLIVKDKLLNISFLLS